MGLKGGNPARFGESRETCARNDPKWPQLGHLGGPAKPLAAQGMWGVGHLGHLTAYLLLGKIAARHLSLVSTPSQSRLS